MKVVLIGDLREIWGSDTEFVEALRAAFPDVKFAPAVTIEEQKRQIEDADAVFGIPEPKVFEAAGKLRWVHHPVSGFALPNNHGLIESDVVLTNAPGPHVNPMADHVFAVMLALTHRIREQTDDQRARRWDHAKYTRRMEELTGRTVGLLGLGGVGMAVARRAHGFGMEVYAVARRPKPPTAEVREVWGPERVEDLLRLSDWFVVTAPLTPETRGMVDRGRLGLLQRGAYVIVVSRARIVDEEALTEALRSGRLAGAGLDDFEQSPLPEDSPLWDMENVIISPHTSSNAPDLEISRMEIFKENLRRFLNDEPFIRVCDKRAGY